MQLILAPMQGLVDDVMRDLLTRIGGFDECVSEFVRITHTVHSRATWLKYVPEIAHANRTPAGTPRRVVSTSAATTTVRMLENVATKGWLAAKVAIPGYRVGIKTGTAQESDGHGGYAKDYLVSMAGVAPADAPRYVVYVALDHATRMNTSEATAPVWRAVTARALQAGGVVPSGTRSPDLPTTW